MYCDILNTFYLKPNGQVPCDDDRGECITLGVVEDAEKWSPDAFFRSEQFRMLRAAEKEHRLPWGGICRECALLQPRENSADGLAHRLIKKFQVEPSTACSLRCPECSRLAQLELRPGRRVMPLAFFENVLAALRRERCEIGMIEYAGQGELLSNKQFPGFVAAARKTFPATRQRVVTNGNYDYSETLSHEWVDELIVSCDGAQQSRYGYDGLGRLVSVTDPRNLVTTYAYNGLGDLLTQSSPDTGATQHTYDAAGNLKTRSDAKGQTTTYQYDAANRVTRAEYADGQITDYIYDQGLYGLGRLTTITHTYPAGHPFAGTLTLAYGYNAQGRLATATQTVGGVAATTAYGYTNGRLTSLTGSGQELREYPYLDALPLAIVQ